VIGESGKVLKRQRVPSAPDGFRQSLGGFGHPIQAVLEASYCWGPMFDWLDEVADEVSLAHPSKVRAIAEARIKTDKIDSETLAHLLRRSDSERVRSIERGSRSQARAATAAIPGTTSDHGEEPHSCTIGSARSRSAEAE
jgi:transposase